MIIRPQQSAIGITISGHNAIDGFNIRRIGSHGWRCQHLILNDRMPEDNTGFGVEHKQIRTTIYHRKHCAIGTDAAFPTAVQLGCKDIYLIFSIINIINI